MANFEILHDNVNQLLSKMGLPKMTAPSPDLPKLLENALRSVWTLDDKNKREEAALEVTTSLKKHFGGKTLEDLYQKLCASLDQERAKREGAEKKKPTANRPEGAEDVPSFDELFGDKK